MLRRVQALVKFHGDVLRFLPDDKPVKHAWKVSCADSEWESPGVFDSPLEFEVFYLDVSRDDVSWRSVLSQAEVWMGTSTDRSRNVEEDSELFSAVKSLCPWDIARVQVARTPMAR